MLSARLCRDFNRNNVQTNRPDPYQVAVYLNPQWLLTLTSAKLVKDVHALDLEDPEGAERFCSKHLLRVRVLNLTSYQGSKFSRGFVCEYLGSLKMTQSAAFSAEGVLHMPVGRHKKTTVGNGRSVAWMSR